MAFTSKKQIPSSHFSGQSIELPKISSSQLEKAAKNFPIWLKNNSSIKQLPAIYQGVLGQVQIAQYDYPGQPNVEYLNRLTDTERVYQLLSTSQLPNEVLVAIWAHVNQTYPGKLINKELCLALALIALFQRSSIKDPFSAIKIERTPPLPILYPNNANNNKYRKPLIDFLEDDSDSQLQDEDIATASFNKPTTIATTNAFIHIEVPSNINNFNYNNIIANSSSSAFRESCFTRLSSNGNLSSTTQRKSYNVDTNDDKAPSILDIDCDQMQLNEEFSMMKRIWSRQMEALKSVFKLTFNVLNVQHGRNNALESLRTRDGLKFIENLARCYPIAHRIWFKVAEIHAKSSQYIDSNFTNEMNDLMTSINESWAVLVNLFDEAGHGELIEVIMDGLNYDRTWATTNDETDEKEIKNQDITDTQNTIFQEGVCAICLTKSPNSLVKEDSITTIKNQSDTSISVNEDDILTMDQYYYYHSSCGNFWLNQVESTLPVVEHKVKSPIQPQRLQTYEKLE